MKIGVITDCLKQPLEKALSTACRLGLDGVQIYATTGIFSPDVLTKKSKLLYKNLLREYHLEVSALCGDMGGYGFEIEKDNTARIEKTKRIVDLAEEFETRVVTTHVGVIPADTENPRFSIMLKALTECGKYAFAKGITLAIETGPEKADTLKKFLDRTEGGVGVNLDPGNFTMVTGQDAVEAVWTLKDYVVHTHLKDGRRLDSKLNPETVYHAFAVGGVEALDACEGFEELPIGHGDVDWDGYIEALRKNNYDGYLTIERETGKNPYEDVESAINFIRTKL